MSVTLQVWGKRDRIECRQQVDLREKSTVAFRVIGVKMRLVNDQKKKTESRCGWRVRDAGVS
ncbi:MAG: hypothetical protein KDI06_10100 [Calditrichaeota bacterium]|nr:hypothetical protein [Calditrichota bacterium]HQU70962.1 hypothetical protein [Calditrichia bacterium]